MLGPNDILTKNFKAGGTIAKFALVKFDSVEDTVIAATAATDKIIGVAQEAGASGGRVDVRLIGLSNVVLGGTVARGAALTAGAAGVAVDLAAAATIKNAVGRAMASGVIGDTITCLVLPFEAVTA